MHIKSIAIGAVLALGVMGSGAALAQSSTNLPTAVGAMTCYDFTQMSASAQTGALPQTDQNSSLTSNSGVNNTTKQGANTDSAVAPLLTAGQLVAACQAAAPSSTVQDAYSHFSTGSTGTTPGGK